MEGEYLDMIFYRAVNFAPHSLKHGTILYSDFAAIIVFALLGIFIIVFALFLQRILAPFRKGALKESTYECGEEAEGMAAMYGMLASVPDRGESSPPSALCFLKTRVYVNPQASRRASERDPGLFTQVGRCRTGWTSGPRAGPR